MFHRVASGPAWSEALARVSLKGLPVALHAHSDLHVYRENKKHYEMVALLLIVNILQLGSMQFMLGFCFSRADPDPFLQIIGMQFIRYNTV